MNRSRSYFIVSSLLLCGLAGCTKREVAGDTITYSFAWWVPWSVFLGVVLAAPVGWLIRQRIERWGWGLVLASPIVLLVFFPGLLTDNLTIDSTKLSLKTGFWFAPSRHELQFGDLASVDLTSKKRYTRRGSRTSYNLVCRRKSGTTQSVPVGDLMKQAMPDIFDRLRTMGIPVTDKSES